MEEKGQVWHSGYGQRSERAFQYSLSNCMCWIVIIYSEGAYVFQLVILILDLFCLVALFQQQWSNYKGTA